MKSLTLSPKKARSLEERKLKKYLTQWGAYARSNDGHFIRCHCRDVDSWNSCLCQRILSKD